MDLIPEQGTAPDLDFATYLKSDAISRSDLLELARSPLHLRHRRKNPQEETDAMLAGKAAHCAILEPERFERAYAIGPTSDRRTKVWKEWRDTITERTCLTEDQGRATKELAESVRSRPNVRVLLEDAKGQNELSFFWRHPATGVRCKGRADRVLADEGIIVDIKSTTGESSPHAFARTISSYSLHLQAAFYCDGLTLATGRRFETWLFVVYEQSAPYASAVYHLSQEAIVKGRIEYEKLLELYVRCVKTNTWEDRSGIVMPIGLPAWHELDLLGLGI